MALKILVVEDDVHISKLLLEFLTRSGFKTESANSAEEAEAILKHDEINAVLTDIKLPGTDGIKFTKNIKKKYNKELKRLTIEDSLTGLYNSRHFFDQLDKEIKRSDRYLHPTSLIFIDIDNFKKINDTYGHMIGDKILALMAKRIKACLRSNDSAYRFAGDEFTIILPETTSSEAKFVADRILSKLANESFVIDEKEISKITSSIGIAEYQMNEGNHQFVHRADATMYETKQRGGNGVIISPAANEPSTTTIPRHS
jgi:diguanylate cyclase (GGDEF)-like protein